MVREGRKIRRGEIYWEARVIKADNSSSAGVDALTQRTREWWMRATVERVCNSRELTANAR